MCDYVFRQLKKNEAEKIYHLIEKRIQWMDDNGIYHWNKYGYLDLFPMSYFEEKADQGEIYGLLDADALIAGCILFEEDEQWQDMRNDVYYIHNFVSDHLVKNSGRMLLENVEKFAVENNKSYLRLDSVADNKKLLAYYKSEGFDITGKIKYGPYDGLLWQKKIK